MKDLNGDPYKRLIQILKYKNYSGLTIKNYSAVVYNFLQWVDDPPSRISNQHFKRYLLEQNFESGSSQNRYISALKFFYVKVLGRKQRFPEFERPRKAKKLPVIIDPDYVISVIDSIENLKHKAILALAFSAGLRRSEILNLKIVDIDSKRMVINVKNAKGKKDRTVLLTEKMLLTLRAYFLKFRPKEYLFNGQGIIKYSSSSIDKISRKYFKKSIHKLRHTYASTMLDNGNSLRLIQDQLGHSSSKTTEIYTHVSLRTLRSAKVHY